MCDADGCNKTDTIRVHLVTGKRGRPPIRFYCSSCIEASKGLVRIAGTAVGPQERAERVEKILPGFDPAALFLLDLQPENLFDPSGGSDLHFHCKGCTEKIKRSERNTHYDSHKSALLAA